jgi:8-oxo-dGTP pyrophosphatase MutT (NUDIX family)
MTDALNPESPLSQLRHVAYTDDDDETGLVPASPAATLVIFAEQADGPPKLLMMRRSDNMRFAAGALVFPGGRVDPDDHVVAQNAVGSDALAPLDAAARVAALRETLEEAGLALGLSRDGRPLTHGAEVEDMRAALLNGGTLSALLSRHRLTVSLDNLAPFSRWRPNFAHARVFDTRFYLVSIDNAESHSLVINDGEGSDLFWATAQSVIDGADAGDHHIIFPTRRNLERLAQYQTYDEAVESTLIFPSRRITPFVEERDGQQFLCIREDCGYPVLSEVMDRAMRG